MGAAPGVVGVELDRRPTSRKGGIVINVYGRDIILKATQGFVVIAAAALFLVASRPSVAVAQTSAICTFPFYAQVFQGPNTGMVLQGNVTLSIEPSGYAGGILTEDNGTVGGLAGQATGRALSILVDVGSDHFAAIGVADGDVRDCGFTRIFGSLVGPAIDDSGSWGIQPPCLPFPACRG